MKFKPSDCMAACDSGLSVQLVMLTLRQAQYQQTLHNPQWVNEAVSRKTGSVANSELDICGRIWQWHSLWKCLSFCYELLKKTTEFISPDTRFGRRVLSCGPP
jgi:hypothetical protein